MDRVPTASEDPAGINHGGSVEGRHHVTAGSLFSGMGGFASGLARAVLRSAGPAIMMSMRVQRFGTAFPEFH